MAYDYSGKLKEAKICRIFFSSPFNGMEGEREELTKRYWPQIHHLCNSKGLQFVAVDMRWGITKESADNAQVVTICLRELDRSDMFVGFFGQRYGWHGAEDEALQQNFSNGNYQDRSVTELEFLHGHLNNPGKLPACIAFRDKKWDDEKRKVAEDAGNKRGIYKYSSESDTATLRMDDLKKRVKETEEKMIGLDLSYQTPKQGAKFMFECIWQHLTQVLLAEPDTKLSERQIEKTLHSAFMTKLCNHYVGGDRYMTSLDDHVKSGNGQRILVLGEHGSGKSALLSNWIRQQTDTDVIVLYHFIGASENSTNYRAILSRLTSELHYEFGVRNSASETDLERKLNYNISANELVDNFNAKLSEAAKNEVKVLVVIDGLEKLTSLGKTGETLFWLPRVFPDNVTMILSTVPEDLERLKVLREDRNYTVVQLESLKMEERSQLCVALLKDSGKELSDYQLNTVISSEKTGNPLFLKVVIEDMCTKLKNFLRRCISAGPPDTPRTQRSSNEWPGRLKWSPTEEMCVFGYFFKLDKKVESLVESKSTDELFGKVLERLEEDYNESSTADNLVKQVFCTIFVADGRIQENDLISMFKIPSHVWSPLFFAFEKLLVIRSGLLGFAYTALRDAIMKRYLTTTDVTCSFQRKLAAYFKGLVQEFKQNGQTVPDYIAQTLPRLECSKAVLLDLSIFTVLVEKHVFDLLDHWSKLESDPMKIVKWYFEQIDLREVELYSLALDEYKAPSVAEEIYPCLKYLEDFMTAGGFHNGRHLVLQRKKTLLENCQHSSPQFYGNHILACLYTIGTLLADTGRLEESEKILLEVKQKQEGKEDLMDEFITTLHGLACTYLYMHEDIKSEELFNEYIELVEKHNCSHLKKCDYLRSAYLNLGNLYMRQQQFEKAVEATEKGVELTKEFYMGDLNTTVGEAMLNLGLTYRKLMRLDEAKDMYLKSLDIKINAVGPSHISLAASYMNLSVLEGLNGNHEQSLDFINQAYTIMKASLPEDQEDRIQCTENVAQALVKLDRFEEAEPYFWIVFEHLTKKNAYHRCLPWVQQQMVNFFLNNNHLEKARRVLPHLAPLEETGLAFRQIHQLDQALPAEERPERPYELTIDAGLERFPGSGILFKYKYEIDLIPSDNLEGLKSLLQGYIEAITPRATPAEIRDHVVNVMLLGMASFCENSGKLEMLIDILEFGLTFYPEDESIERALYPKYAHSNIGRFQDAYKTVTKLCKTYPDDVTLHLHAALICDSLGIPQEGLTYLDIVEKQNAENSDVMEKVTRIRTSLNTPKS